MIGKRWREVALGVGLAACIVGAKTHPLRAGASRIEGAAGASPNFYRASRTGILATHAALPLNFELNQGQVDRRVRFLARSKGCTVFLTDRGAALTAAERSSTGLQRASLVALRMEFINASTTARITGEEKLAGRTSYFLGNSPSRWRSNIPNFARVRYDDLYPGIDLIYYGSAGEIEDDFLVAPGADPKAIRVVVRRPAAKHSRDFRIQPHIASNGDLEMQTQGIEIRLRKPQAYQVLGGERRGVAARYHLRGKEVGFEIGSYRHDRPLVIDPALSITYSTFLGGAGSDSANSLAVDPSGNAYIGGATTLPAFPESATAVLGASGGSDLFVAKVDTTKNGAASLIYLTFLGGSGDDTGGIVTVDSTGNAAILGVTTSSDFPVTDGSKRTSGANDLTVSRLDASGHKLLFSTYFGGSGAEATHQTGGIALDPSGNIVVTSDTTSTDLPTTSGAFSTHYGGGSTDGFLIKYSPVGQILYCTYLGINATVSSAGVAADAAGHVYLAGSTSMPTSSTFPTTNGFQTTYGGGPFDAFLMQINPAGQSSADLIYATFLGGGSSDRAAGIAVDQAMPPNAYVIGTTQSSDFPTNGTNAPFQPGLQGPSDAFLAVVSQTQSGAASLLYSTYVGGLGDDAGLSVVVASPNKVYAAGKTTSVDFPARNSLQPFSGISDVFVAKLDPTVSGPASLVYATYLGGSVDAQGNAMAVDSSGGIYLAGETTSLDFPQAANPSNGFQPICGSCGFAVPLADAFLTKITEGSGPAPGVTFLPAGLNFGNEPVGQTASLPSVQLENSGDSALTITGVSVTGPNSKDFSQTNDTCPIAPATLAAGASCAIAVTFSPSAPAEERAAISVFDNSTGSPHAASLRGIGTEAVAVLSSSTMDFGSQPQGTTSNEQVVTVSNNGNVSLHLTRVDLNSQDFSFGVRPAPDTCSGGEVIAAGSSCVRSVVFSPVGTGPFAAELDITDDSGNTAGSVQRVLLSGTGTPPAAIVNLEPHRLDFGTQVVGGSTGPRQVKLRNEGSVALHISSIRISGTNPTDFNLTSSNAPCPTGTAPLAPGMDCALVADFAPQSRGAKSASITIVDDAADSPETVPLSGTGTAPVVALSPARLTFNGQNVGTTSASQSATLSNAGDAPLDIGMIGVTGTNGGDFTETNNCPPNVNPSNHCVLSVSFKPSGTGARTAAVTFADNATGTPQSLPLDGTGTAPAVTFMPGSVNFNAQLVKSASSAVTVTVENSGTGPLDVSSISFAGANPGDFSESDNCHGASIAVSTNCAVSVTFTPQAAGPRSATLVMNDDAPASPQSVAISGMAMDFTMDAAPGGSMSASVTAGQPATYNLQISSQGGFNGAVGLSCSGAPPAATCAVSPATVSLSGTAAVPFAVTVTTAHAFGVRTTPDEPRRGFLHYLVPIIAVFLATVITRRRFGDGQRLAFRRLVPAAAILFFLTLASCGGGGGGGGGFQGTPPNKYTLMVVASAQGGSRTLNLTLTVQ
jgi:hypothetical protein